MSVKIKELKDEGMVISFKAKNLPIPFANAIRRSCLVWVPTYAIDEVVMYENNSAFFDEYIANRIGLIPITTPKTYDEEVMFTLNVEGPMTVFSEKLESNHPKVRVANTKIPLIELGPKQVLRLEGIARKGTGRRHAKFQPGFIRYGYEKEDEVEFYVESFGQMKAKDILQRALEGLISRCKEVEKALQ